MNNKVEIVYLQTATTIPGIFSTQTTLDARGSRQSKTQGIRMSMSVHGLVVSKDNIMGVIPYANVKVMVLKGGQSEASPDKAD
jgi:hypothetical protein